MTTTQQPTLSVYQLRAVIDGYSYECSCGELYRSESDAICCRKCRAYSEHGYCTEVYDVLTGTKVWESPGLVMRREIEAREAEYQRRAKAPFTLGDICPELAQISF